MSKAGSRRPYRSRVRQEQAARTKAAIIDAAQELFAEHGWEGTSMRAIARAAGVAEATLYATHGTKAGLAVALVDVADERAGIEEARARLAAAEGNPVAQMLEFVRYERQLYTDSGAFIAVILDGRRNSPELAAAYADGRGRGDGARRATFSTWPADVWRDGVDVQTALDIYAGLCTFDAFRVLRDERGWDAERIEHWWGEILCQTLFA